MRRSCSSAGVFALGLLCGSLLLPGRAAAGDMDPALSRLRVGAGNPGCEDQPNGIAWCANQEAFERLASELAVTMAPLVASPVRTGGPRGLSLQLDTSVTGIDPGPHWQRGSEGAPGSEVNSSPAPALVWNRAAVHKGLPFGFEVGGSVGQGLSTSLWALGVSLKWALVEGFRSGLGALPDVAVQLGTTRMMGSEQLQLSTHTLDLMLSKPIVAGRGWTISPLLGAQLLVVDAESGWIDLSPGPLTGEGDPSGDDAFGSCSPSADATTRSAPLECSEPDGGADFASSVRFGSVSQARMRVSLGGQVRRGVWLASAAFGFDVFEPAVEATRYSPDATSPNHVRQLSVRVIVGAAL